MSFTLFCVTLKNSPITKVPTLSAEGRTALLHAAARVRDEASAGVLGNSVRLSTRRLIHIAKRLARFPETSLREEVCLFFLCGALQGNCTVAVNMCLWVTASCAYEWVWKFALAVLCLVARGKACVSPSVSDCVTRAHTALPRAYK